MILRKSFYIRWSAGRSPRVHEVNPGRDSSRVVLQYSHCISDMARQGRVGRAARALSGRPGRAAKLWAVHFVYSACF